MNEYEKRRRELLKQTRAIYEETTPTPAIHPRYQRINGSLYDTTPKSMFGIRFAIAVVIFLMFFTMHQNEIRFRTIDSQYVAQKVSEDLLYQEFPTFIKRFQLFKNFRFFN